jgi:hypothetical protein
VTSQINNLLFAALLFEKILLASTIDWLNITLRARGVLLRTTSYTSFISDYNGFAISTLPSTVFQKEKRWNILSILPSLILQKKLQDSSSSLLFRKSSTTFFNKN